MSEQRRQTRDERIAELVADGWSREFAEAFVPMTIAEMRAKGLRSQGYRSEMTGFVNRRRGTR